MRMIKAWNSFLVRNNQVRAPDTNRVKQETWSWVRRMNRDWLAALLSIELLGESDEVSKGQCRERCRGLWRSWLQGVVGVNHSCGSKGKLDNLMGKKHIGGWWIHRRHLCSKDFLNRNNWRLLVEVSYAWVAMVLFLRDLHLVLELCFDPGCPAVHFHVVCKRLLSEEYNIYVEPWVNDPVINVLLGTLQFKLLSEQTGIGYTTPAELL